MASSELSRANKPSISLLLEHQVPPLLAPSPPYLPLHLFHQFLRYVPQHNAVEVPVLGRLKTVENLCPLQSHIPFPEVPRTVVPQLLQDSSFQQLVESPEALNLGQGAATVEGRGQLVDNLLLQPLHHVGFYGIVDRLEVNFGLGLLQLSPHLPDQPHLVASMVTAYPRGSTHLGLFQELFGL